MDTTPETMSEPIQTNGTDSYDDGDWIASPLDDETYDLLMALASKLEAIDTYRVYASDGNPELWRHIAEANDIDDPMRLKLGSTVLVPALEEIQHG